MAAEAKETGSLDAAKAKIVLRQVEFYFSDSNLPRDNFLRKTVEESEDGLVSLALICSFGRMRSHLGLENGTKPESVPENIVNAVSEVLKSQSTTLRISDDGKKVGRIAELLKPKEVIEQVDSRTIAASPLPYDVQLEKVESFFGTLAKVNSVRLPRHADRRCLVGAALIEFSEEEDAKRVLKESLTFEGVDLELKPKKDYEEEREQVLKLWKERKKSDQDDGYQKGLIIYFKLTKKESEKKDETDSTEKPSEKKDETDSTEKPIEGETEKVEGETEKVDGENEKVEGETEKVEVETEKVEGETEKVDGENEKVEGENNKSEEIITREDIKAIFSKFGNIKYIDFARGQENGHIRFEEPEGAEKARAMAALSDDGGILVNDYIATVEAVTGEEERKYWAEVLKTMDSRGGRGGGRGGGRHNNRGGRGSYGGKHGRRNDSSDRRQNKTPRAN